MFKGISVNDIELIHHFVFQLPNQSKTQGGNCTTEVKQYLHRNMSSKQPSVFPPAQQTIKCAGCDSGLNINWFCKNCASSLCETCKTRHETDQFLRSHRIESRTGCVIRAHGSSNVNERCLEHPDKEISGYCNDCSVPSCMTCITEKHRRHDVIAIEMKYKECEVKINETVIDIKKNAIVRLQSSIEDLREKLNTSDRKVEDVKSEVDKFRQQLKNAVDKSYDKLIFELEERQTEQKTAISDIIKDFEKQISENQQIMSVCADKISKGGLELIEFCKVPIPSYIHTIPDISQVTPKFVPQGNLVQTIMQDLGEIRWEGTVTSSGKDMTAPSRSESSHGKERKTMMCYRSESVSILTEDGKIEGKSTVLRPTTGVKVISTFDTENACISLVITDKGNAWLSGQHCDALYMYNDRGSKVKSVTVRKGSYIWDICVKRSGDVIVCYKDNKVGVMTAKGEVSTPIDTAPFSPQGVCLTEREEILVCMAGQKDRNHVAVYLADGQSKVRDIVVKDSKGKQLLTDPYRVLMNSENISILNCRSNVVTAGQDGKVKWVYDGAQSKLGKVDAVGMCIDKFCNLFISAYGNDCVHYVDREGCLIQIILSNEQHGICLPWGIGMDNETGDIWLGSFNRHVKIFRYLQN